MDFWLGISAAYVLTGDGRAAISAAHKVETVYHHQRFYRTIALLLTAAGHAVEGDRDEADAFLDRARRLRNDLYRGRKEDWEDSLLEMVFA